MKVLVAQSCPTLCHPIDCSPSGSAVHGILQARILEWVAVPFSRGSPQPRTPDTSLFPQIAQAPPAGAHSHCPEEPSSWASWLANWPLLTRPLPQTVVATLTPTPTPTPSSVQRKMPKRKAPVKKVQRPVEETPPSALGRQSPTASLEPGTEQKQLCWSWITEEEDGGGSPQGPGKE